MSMDQRMDELHKELNPEQREAAETIEGPVMMVAGAGAGKTKTLIHRVASMIENDISPASIMVVTFTNKAASEIKDRLELMVGDHAQYIMAGTFHSVVFREVLKKNPESSYLQSIGIDMDQTTILDESDSRSLIKEVIANLSEEDLQTIRDEEWEPGHFTGEMSIQRAKGIDVSRFMQRIQPGESGELFKNMTARIWNAYNQACRSVNGIDFDDILLIADRMLNEDPHIAEELSREFRYIMLDEYQDTNPVQMSIMDSIAQHHRNICVVGDEKQSIYRFRGADINVFLSFNKRYPEVKTIDMKRNYRSCLPVIQFANACASCMSQKITDGQLMNMLKLDTDPSMNRSRGDNTASLVNFRNQNVEAAMIVDSIERDMKKGVDPSEIAVLYRNRSLKGQIEKELVSRKVDYNIIGDTSFYQRAEVKDAIALARFVFRPWDSRAGFRVLDRSVMGLSLDRAKSLMDVNMRSRKNDQEESPTLMNVLEDQAQARLKAKNKDDEPPLKGSARRIQPFVDQCKNLFEANFYRDFETQQGREMLRDVLSDVWECYLYPAVEKDHKRAKDNTNETLEGRVENVRYVFNRFIDDLSEGLEVDEALDNLIMMAEPERSRVEEYDDKIKLMTIHASKGLEFERVYAIGLDNMALSAEDTSPEEMEEARRLLYVALTRAKHRVVLSSADQRLQFGQVVNTRPSDFLMEIEKGTGARIKTINATKPPERKGGVEKKTVNRKPASKHANNASLSPS